MNVIHLGLFSILFLLLVTFYASFGLGWIVGLATFLAGSYLLFSTFFYDHTQLWIVLCALTVIFMFAPIRRILFARILMSIMRKVLPPIGETERIALEAGTVWWDKELFSGNPNWKEMMDFKIQPLSEEEKQFLDGPVEKLCEMGNDWEINQKWDLSEEIWSFLKEHKFFGMIIPKKYGGLGFSAQAHSEIITKLGSRSSAIAVTVMVPNSLGPAELLLHYGTDQQKDYYLPRLAKGEEIPCFALTEPQAGSDASSLKSTGIICNGVYNGEATVGIRLNWEKRWITLAPISTLIGLAFQLLDPDHILGTEEDIGITCALIPANLPGIEVGKRHNPLHAAFQNGPTRGKDVFVPLDFIIGGPKNAGQGWRMLMESLAAGRSISLPAMACGNSKLAVRTVAAHGQIREQFNMSIAKFEGVEEKIANMAGLMYLSDASRKLTAAAVDAGEKPSVVSAIMKAYTTENARQIVNDAMDIRAGASITLGPKNPLGSIYMSIPISITVEGANILTRTLIIFGQGAIRCHPFVQKEIGAIEKNDSKAFDAAFFGHVGHVIRNSIRTLLLGLTSARLAITPGNCPQKRMLQKLTRMSAAFAFLTDVSMGVIGGALKRKEKISGRLADILSWMYLATACVKRYQDDGEKKQDLPFIRWTTELCFYNIQKAFYGVFANFTPGFLGWFLKKMIFPYGAPFRLPVDRLGHEMSRALFENPSVKESLTQGMFIPKGPEEGLGFMENTLRVIYDAETSMAKVKAAISKKIVSKHSTRLFQDALDKKIISLEEKTKLDTMEQLKRHAIEVDEFDQTFFSNPKIH